jgi:5-methylcytosine-specific restriction endonuclease McrA
MFSKENQLKSKRIKQTQRQKGEISQQTRREVYERSNGACEICDRQRATQMAHITSRKTIGHKTTSQDLIHTCVECHQWLDQTTEGKQFKKNLLIDRSRSYENMGI